MSSDKATTPTWVAPLMGALLTVAATWGTIQTEVPAIVERKVAEQLQAHRLQLALKADSLWSSTEAAIMARVDSATTHAADTVLARLGFMQDQLGRPQAVLPPHIVVQRDTALARRMDVSMAYLVAQLTAINMRLANNTKPRATSAAETDERR